MDKYFIKRIDPPYEGFIGMGIWFESKALP